MNDPIVALLSLISQDLDNIDWAKTHQIGSSTFIKLIHKKYELQYYCSKSLESLSVFDNSDNLLFDSAKDKSKNHLVKSIIKKLLAQFNEYANRVRNANIDKVIQSLK